MYLQISCTKKKMLILRSLLVAENCRKRLPFLLLSESLCLPITPFHVLLSVSTCALKLPSRTSDSADATFCKATLTSFKKFGTVFQLMYSKRSCSIRLRKQTFPRSRILSVT